MNRASRKLFFACAVVLLSNAPSGAEQSGNAKSLVGDWSLVSQYVELDGKKIEAFGSKPRGLMMLSANGKFSIILMRDQLPKFASNNRVKGSAEENQAVVQGSIAYFGSYKVNSAKGDTVQVSMRVEASTFPNWDGEDQPRDFTLAGDEMRATSPKAAIGGVPYVVWRRIR
ncbi:MAG: lipocalin-like domain-containing protein [Xanthobacteraceae bacterium]|nr:lipocalin-like domain-containing protein [Xanthobacteraceae bacterium]